MPTDIDIWLDLLKLM